MATKIITKNSSTTTAIPTAGDLVQGELAVNVTDKRLFTENSAGAIVELGTNPSTIDINAGTIDGTVIGGTTAAAGSFTTLGTTGAATFSGNVNSTAAGENLFSNVGNVSLAVQSSATDKISIGVEQGVGGTFVASGGALKFRVGGYTAAFDKAQIDPSGNVGVGTSSPFFTAAGRTSLSVNGTSSSILAFGKGGSSENYLLADAGGFTIANTSATLPTTFFNNGSERMRLSASGNLGIGTATITNPYSQSNFTDVNINGVWGGAISFKLGGVTKGWVGQRSSGNEDMVIGATTGQELLFYENNAEAMRISSGNLLVGTTGLPVANGKLSVAGASRFLESTDAASPIACDKVGAGTTATQRFVIFTVASQSTGCGQINANGASQAAFGTFSDATLKENIVNLPDQYENIRALRPVEFDYIESEGGGHQVGFIAQEMQEVYPCCVGEREDGKLTVGGWNKTEARLVSALQSAMNKIDALTARIEALEGA